MSCDSGLMMFRDMREYVTFYGGGGCPDTALFYVSRLMDLMCKLDIMYIEVAPLEIKVSFISRDTSVPPYILYTGVDVQCG